MGLRDVNTRMLFRFLVVVGFHFSQELLTTKPPFHEILALKAVISRILQGAPSRPNDNDTCGRLTDAWWSICYSCWRREPSLRPSIPEVFEGFNNLSTLVCNPITWNGT